MSSCFSRIAFISNVSFVVPYRTRADLHSFPTRRSSDLIAVLKNADIFLFPSRYEGFPLALGEAMSVGLPAIGLESCSGVNKLIVDGESGYLVENVEAMASRLKQLMNNSALRQEMGKRGVELMRAYTPASVLAKWDELIYDIVEQ